MTNEEQNDSLLLLTNPTDAVAIIRSIGEKRAEDNYRFNEDLTEPWQEALEPGDTVLWSDPRTNEDCFTVITDLLMIDVVNSAGDAVHKRKAFRGPTYIDGVLMCTVSVWVGLAIAGVFVEVEDAKLMSAYNIVGISAMFKAAKTYDPIQLRGDYAEEQQLAADTAMEDLFEIAEKYSRGGNG